MIALDALCPRTASEITLSTASIRPQLLFSVCLFGRMFNTTTLPLRWQWTLKYVLSADTVKSHCAEVNIAICRREGINLSDPVSRAYATHVLVSPQSNSI
jgi:hypothetical protein